MRQLKPFTNENPRAKYASPRLLVYGRLSDLTREQNGDGSDAAFLGSREATGPSKSSAPGSRL